MLRMWVMSFVLVFLSGCAATRISTSAFSSAISDADSVLISTPWDGEIGYGTWAQIVAADGEKFSAWHLKVPPGRHQIVLKDMRSGLTRDFIVDTKIGYRYDLTFDGRGWESTRNPLDDAKFLGINGLQPNTPLIADGNGLFTDAVKLRAAKELMQRAEQDARVAQQEALKAWKSSPAGKEQTRNKERMYAARVAAQQEEQARSQPLVRTVGQKICKVLHGIDRQILGSTNTGQTRYGVGVARTYYVTAFTEKVAGQKIQLRIASIRKEIDLQFENVESIDGDTVLRPNTLLWDDSTQWQPCN